MSWDYIPGKNAAGHNDRTAADTLRKLQRSRQGLQNRIAGENFENLIESSLQWYELRGVACVEKTPEPMKPLGKPNKKGQFLACYEKRAQPDYKGTMQNGRAVVFEAKHTSGGKIEAGRVTDEQRERLLLHHRLGAAVFVLVSFDLTDFYRVPFETWHHMAEIYGHKHMKKHECEPFRVPYIAGVLKVLEGIESEGGNYEKAD